MHAMFFESLRKAGLYLYSLDLEGTLISALCPCASGKCGKLKKKQTHTYKTMTRFSRVPTQRSYHIFTESSKVDKSYALTLLNHLHFIQWFVLSAKAWTNTDKFCIKISEAGQPFRTRSHTDRVDAFIRAKHTISINAFSVRRRTNVQPAELLVPTPKYNAFTNVLSQPLPFLSILRVCASIFISSVIHTHLRECSMKAWAPAGTAGLTQHTKRHQTQPRHSKYSWLTEPMGRGVHGTHKSISACQSSI